MIYLSTSPRLPALQVRGAGCGSSSPLSIQQMLAERSPRRGHCVHSPHQEATDSFSMPEGSKPKGSVEGGATLPGQREEQRETLVLYPAARKALSPSCETLGGEDRCCLASLGVVHHANSSGLLRRVSRKGFRWGLSPVPSKQSVTGRDGGGPRTFFKGSVSPPKILPLAPRYPGVSGSHLSSWTPRFPP